VSFEARIKRAAERNETRTVLALDLEDSDPQRLLTRSRELIREVNGLICAIKINRQLVMSLGLKVLADSILKLANELSLPTIIDAKLNDVGHTNLFMARTYFDLGFDAVIASPIVGWENGLDMVFEAANSRNKAVILLAYMSNPGAQGFYSLMAARPNGPAKPIFEMLTDLALQWKAHGVVVGATKPDIIARIRQLAGPSLSIYSPGIGSQGGDARKALVAGSTYLIVGRAIYNSPEPSKAAMELRMAP
jgi:orotidine-5'-phosphate decarboxylase